MKQNKFFGNLGGKGFKITIFLKKKKNSNNRKQFPEIIWVHLITKFN